MVSELEATNEQLKKYAAEVEELAVVEERNRLARELHDSVSQAMFGIVLATRSAQIMREKRPEGSRRSSSGCRSSPKTPLARMRGFIAELRPKRSRTRVARCRQVLASPTSQSSSSSPSPNPSPGRCAGASLKSCLEREFLQGGEVFEQRPKLRILIVDDIADVRRDLRLPSRDRGRPRGRG